MSWANLVKPLPGERLARAGAGSVIDNWMDVSDTVGAPTTPTESSTNKRVDMSRRFAPLAKLVDSDRFNLFISLVIVANAIVLGLGTFSGIDARYGATLNLLNEIAFSIYVIELVLRLISYAPKPQDFFKSGWNVFDFVIITASFVPALRENAQILRLLRLARILRLLRFLPKATLMFDTVKRAVPPVFTTIAFIALFMFIYGMVGQMMFGKALPEDWGNIAYSMRTLFVLLTLEGLPEYLAEAREVTPWATWFMFSYVGLASFFVLNLIIGIVVSANEEAHERARVEDELKRGVQKKSLAEEVAAIQRSMAELHTRISAFEEQEDKERPAS